jgi:methionyl aminopeptidase
MIDVKTEKEIGDMKEGGARLRKVVQQLLPSIQPGVTTAHIDKEAERLLIAAGVEPSFKRVKGYHWSICIPINDQVVHTPPSEQVIKEGDLVTLDIGAYYRGFHTDWATTVVAGGVTDKKVDAFLAVGREALKKGLAQVAAGNRIGQISEAIEKEVYGAGYYILKQLTGHGVGRELHEDPFIPGILEKAIAKTPLIKPGMTFAIEVIYSMGTEEIDYEEGDDWSVVTRDRSLSACFEETIAVSENKSFILT